MLKLRFLTQPILNLPLKSTSRLVLFRFEHHFTTSKTSISWHAKTPCHLECGSFMNNARVCTSNLKVRKTFPFFCCFVNFLYTSPNKSCQLEGWLVYHRLEPRKCGPRRCVYDSVVHIRYRENGDTVYHFKWPLCAGSWKHILELFFILLGLVCKVRVVFRIRLGLRLQ